MILFSSEEFRLPRWFWPLVALVLVLSQFVWILSKGDAELALLQRKSANLSKELAAQHKKASQFQAEKSRFDKLNAQYAGSVERLSNISAVQLDDILELLSRISSQHQVHLESFVPHEDQRLAFSLSITVSGGYYGIAKLVEAIARLPVVMAWDKFYMTALPDNNGLRLQATVKAIRYLGSEK